MNVPSSQYKMNNGEVEEGELAEALGMDSDQRILAFHAQAPASATAHRIRSTKKTAAVTSRTVLREPERVLDAPGLTNDYYLNLLSWSCANVVAIGLECCVYLWYAETGEVIPLMEGDTAITSVQWGDDGLHLAVGTEAGEVQIWDAEQQTRVRSITGRDTRVGVLSWDRHILASGAKDGSIWLSDVRVAQHLQAELLGHDSQVCGLAWKSTFLASGGNDNLVNVWDSRTNCVRFCHRSHTAAVKALSWCPWQTNILASGGGSHDRHIYFYNINNGAQLSSVDTGSQVTALIWSPTHHHELMSAHGFPDNQLTLWRFPSLEKVADIPAHENRVLHAAVSSDGTMVATVASDEDLKFWRLWELPPAKKCVANNTGNKTVQKHIR